jgi:hypothetical protein
MADHLYRQRLTADRVVVALIALSLALNLPLATITGAFADDWSWVYLSHFEGPGALMRAIKDAAHPLYGPWYAGFLLLGETGLWLSRSAAVGLHLLNGYLLFLVLRRPRLTRRVSVLAVALFLVSPFYTVRGSYAHDQYDLFLTAWLLSVVSMQARSAWLRALAPLEMAFSMGLEPMLMLEPLRFLYVRQRKADVRSALKRVWVFWLVGLAVIALRFAIYSPSGHYAGYRPLTLDPLSLLGLLFDSLRHFAEALEAAAYNAWHLLPLWQLAIAAALALFVFWLLPAPSRLARYEWKAVPLGVAMVLFAALPYAILGEHLWPYRFESRFAFLPQIGAVIAIAGLVQMLPVVPLRRAVALILFFVSALSVLGDAKWLRLDQALQQDMTAQLEDQIKNRAEPVLVRLTIEPPSYALMYRYRCLGANDLNVPLALLDGNKEPRSFVYETSCGDWRPVMRVCTVSYLDTRPCPLRVIEARYVVDIARSSVASISLWDALGWTSRRPSGHLEFGEHDTPNPSGPGTNE